VQFAVPSRSAGYEPIDPAFSGVLDNVDAHTLARSGHFHFLAMHEQMK
jgi:hypothetical protein